MELKASTSPLALAYCVIEAIALRSFFPLSLLSRSTASACLNSSAVGCTSHSFADCLSVICFVGKVGFAGIAGCS